MLLLRPQISDTGPEQTGPKAKPILFADATQSYSGKVKGWVWVALTYTMRQPEPLLQK